MIKKTIIMTILSLVLINSAYSSPSYQYRGTIEDLIKDMLPIKQELQKHSFIAQGKNPFEPIDDENVTITLNPKAPHKEIDRILSLSTTDIDKYYIKPAIYKSDLYSSEHRKGMDNATVIVNSAPGYTPYPLRNLRNPKVEKSMLKAFPNLFSNSKELRSSMDILQDYYTQFTIIHELAHGSDFTDTPQVLTYYGRDKYAVIAEMIADVASLLTILSQSDISNDNFENLITGLIAFRSSDLWLLEKDSLGNEHIKAQRPKHATTPALSIILKEYLKNPGYFKSLKYKDIIGVAYNTAIRTARYALTMNELETVASLERIENGDLSHRIKAISSQYIH